jgi:DNA-binding NarL/FixJ family response regulator
MIRVLVVDDHKIARDAVSEILAGAPDVCVVGQASDGVEAVELAGELLPDFVVMDISMPRMNGVEAALRVREKWPDIQVVLITALAAEVYQEVSKACGARDFVPKDMLHVELIPTLRRAARIPA